MQHLWPPPAAPGHQLDTAGLTGIYRHPAPGVPFVRLNFVASADGAVSVDGVSGGLHAPGDGTVFGLLRELADVVLVGAGTARAEDYRGARTSPERRVRRLARGQSAVPPIAVVATTGDLDPGARLFTDTSVAPLVLTAASAAAATRARLGDGDITGGAGVEVVAASGADPDRVDPAAVLDALAACGLHRVLCEGGPALAASLAAADRVDELCLSVAPSMVGPGPGRIVAGTPLASVAALRLASVVGHDDGLLLRYRTPRGDAADPPAPPFE